MSTNTLKTFVIEQDERELREGRDCAWTLRDAVIPGIQVHADHQCHDRPKHKGRCYCGCGYEWSAHAGIVWEGGEVVGGTAAVVPLLEHGRAPSPPAPESYERYPVEPTAEELVEAAVKDFGSAKSLIIDGWQWWCVRSGLRWEDALGNALTRESTREQWKLSATGTYPRLLGVGLKAAMAEAGELLGRSQTTEESPRGEGDPQ